MCVCVCLRIRFKMLRHILHLHANSILSGGGNGRHFDQIILKDELSILDIALIALKKKLYKADQSLLLSYMCMYTFALCQLPSKNNICYALGNCRQNCHTNLSVCEHIQLRSIVSPLFNCCLLLSLSCCLFLSLSFCVQYCPLTDWTGYISTIDGRDSVFSTNCSQATILFKNNSHNK